MATVNFYLKNPKENKETPIHLIFWHKGERIRISIGTSIHPNHWNIEKQQAKKSFPGSSELNGFLSGMAKEVEKIYSNAKLNDNVPTAEYLKEKLNEIFNKKPKKKHTLFSFIEDYIDSVKATKKRKTVDNYRNTLRHLRAFQKHTKKKLDFENINLDFYNDFIEYFTVEKNFAYNTIGKQVTILKVLLNEATERGINTKLDFKSKRFKRFSEQTDAIYLTEEEILNLYNLNLSKIKRLERVRDLFIVGCYTGLRFSDFSQITPENIYEKDGRKFIKISTQKTGETITIPFHWTVEQIMGKYKEQYFNSLPRATSNQKMNEYLKEIGKYAELDENVSFTKTIGGMKTTITRPKCEYITTHTARRSFATNLYLQGFPAISIMKITGHRTEKAFLRYIKITPEQNAIKLAEHWSKQQPMLKAV